LSLRGCYEPETTRLLKRRLNEGDFAVDVGGHIGHHTTTMRQHVGEDGMLWVFEPNEKMPDISKNIVSKQMEKR
jgi:ubiquinone/menaquinone biosynthesis C-methylase UbiE